jgi:hypothetical protein
MMFKTNASTSVISEQRPHLFIKHQGRILLEAFQLIPILFFIWRKNEKEKAYVIETKFLKAGCRIHRGNCASR